MRVHGRPLVAAGALHTLFHIPDGEEGRLLLGHGGDSAPLVARRAGKCQQVVRFHVTLEEMRQGSAGNIKGGREGGGTGGAADAVVSDLIPILDPDHDPGFELGRFWPPHLPNGRPGGGQRSGSAFDGRLKWRRGGEISPGEGEPG